MQPTCDLCLLGKTCFAKFSIEKIVKKITGDWCDSISESYPGAQIEEDRGRLKRPLAKMCKYYREEATP